MDSKSVGFHYTVERLSRHLTYVRPVAFFCLLLLASAAVKATEVRCEQLFQTETFFSDSAKAQLLNRYQDHNCHLNALNTAKELIKLGVPPQDMQFVLISRYSGMEALLPQRARNKTDGWKFHVALRVQDRIYDLDFQKPAEPIPIQEYFKKMFSEGGTIPMDLNVQVYSYEQALKQFEEHGNLHPLFQLVDSKQKQIRLTDYLRAIHMGTDLQQASKIDIYGYGLGQSLWSALRLPFKLAMIRKGSYVRFQYLKKQNTDRSDREVKSLGGTVLAVNTNFMRLQLKDGSIVEIPIRLIETDTIEKITSDEGPA